MIGLPWFYLRYRLGNLTTKDLGREVRALRGVSVEELKRIAQSAWENWERRDLYPEIEGHLRRCVESGAFTAFASTSFDLILEPIARELGITEIVASQLEIVDGVATGWVASDPCYAEVKARRVAELLRHRGIASSEVAFYSDSFHDLPLLELVAHPVAVYPDPLLSREARRRGWPIIRRQTRRS